VYNRLKEHPTLKEFIKFIEMAADDAGVMHNDEGYINSHDLIGHIDIYDDNTEKHYKIEGMDIDRLLGCMCASGITLYVKEVDED